MERIHSVMGSRNSTSADGKAHFRRLAMRALRPGALLDLGAVQGIAAIGPN